MMQLPATSHATGSSGSDASPIAFAMSIDAAAAALGADIETGLLSVRVSELQSRFGRNELTEAPPASLWRRILGQFKDLVIWILIAAAFVSGAVGEWVDTLAILSIVLLNGVIGFLQEERAEKALAALQKLSSPMAKVLRDGLFKSVPAADIVPGDVFEIEAGDNIPADARLVKAFSLSVQEAALTGESVPIEKDAGVVLAFDVPLGDRRNMVYMGTVAASGRGCAVAVATGMQTELGHIAGLLGRHESQSTPLQRRLAELGRILIVVCMLIVGVIFTLQLSREGHFVEAFMLSVSLAVAAVPEGLPAVVTIALALGLQRMVRRNALVRKLPSVETLGSVTVICSDKTGTLTRNEMTVQEILVGHTRYHISGTGYLPRGSFFRDGEVSTGLTDVLADCPKADVASDPDLQLALTIGTWCNNSRLIPAGNGSDIWQILGDPTEGALVVAAMKAGIEAIGREDKLLYEIPFDCSRRLMSVVLRQPNGDAVMYVKGAPEAVLNSCSLEQRGGFVEPLTDLRRTEILDGNAGMAHRALRVLALAYRPNPPSIQDGDSESELVFVGLAGMIDPPREEARLAVQKCREAGIRPVMITGDHPATALAVGEALGLVREGELAISGRDLDAMTAEELAMRVDRISVFARASAEHKLRIVNAWRSSGQVVAMTGDGVNDAPAIKAADIGIAMGITGTDVTKEASDMVLMDDNFASIVSAVEEGRGIFDNIQKVLQFLLSCNFGEILLMFVASLLGWPAPLLPIHLLWINLVTDGLPALALSLEPPEKDVMHRKPRRPDESILSAHLGLVILLQGLLVAIVGLSAFGISYSHYPGDFERARAMTFCVVVYAELFRALAARSPTRTQFQLGFWSNPYLLLAVAVSGMLQVSIAAFPFAQRVFSLPQHTALEWWAIVLLSLTPVTVIELGKIVRPMFRKEVGNTESSVGN